MSTHIINQIIPRVTPNGILSSFLLGVGLSYSIETENYSHIPVVLLFPTAYSGYQVYKNKDIILYNIYVVLLSKKLK